MSGASVPVSRPVGRAMIIGNPDCRAAPRATLGGIGYQCAEVDDPYAAMAEICRRPLVYRALIISLNSLFREELPLVETIKRRFPHIEIWLTDTDGRQAALAEALSLGADGLIADDGLHRIGTGQPLQRPAMTPIAPPPQEIPEETQSEQPPPPAPEASASEESSPPSDATGEPVLTAEELRALLQDDDE